MPETFSPLNNHHLPSRDFLPQVTKKSGLLWFFLLFLLTNIPNEELSPFGFAGQSSDFLAVEADRRHLQIEIQVEEEANCVAEVKGTDRVDVLIEL